MVTAPAPEESQESEYQRELRHEQNYVDGLFARLDNEVSQATERLRLVQLNTDPANPAAEALVQRETEYHSLNARLDRLNLAQLGLVFGRIDIHCEDTRNIDNPLPGEPTMDRRYIGRMGLDAREENYRTLLLDWRAPMARPFYLATTAQPEGVRLRRHLRTHGRTVTDFDDEFLSGNQAGHQRGGVGSESALFHVLQQPRTSRMKDIVETIQREQDEIIRDSTRGILVVEGGPGTGKTAVALHRVAYLLYTWREQLARTGVLIIGPNRTFLDYISHVLPELGETGTVLSTIGDLYPGISGTGKESLLVREIKGSAEMVEILSEEVRHYQVLPEEIRYLQVDGITLQVTPSMVKAARTKARRSRRPHNLAQSVFREELLHRLAQQMAGTIGADPLGGANLLHHADIDQLHDDLAEEPEINDLVAEFWPELSPTTVLRRLLEDKNRIAYAARAYDTETQEALYRPSGSSWSPTDAALLDELAVLVGMPDPEEEQRRADDNWRQKVTEAQEALDILASSANTDTDDEEFEAEILGAHDVIDAETLAQRQETRDSRSTAERASADYTWAYGHVIVDEAQELSPMEWRMVMRRCPSRWMTLVGDTAQTGSPAGVDSWAETLSPFVGSRFRYRTMTVNYRTPSQIMEIAHQVLRIIDPDSPGTQAIRDSDYPVRFLASGTNPQAIIDELSAEEPDRLSAIISANDSDCGYSVDAIKGLEFDHVVLVEPRKIVEQSPQGWQDLFVALTRATQSLTVIGEVPKSIDIPECSDQAT
ncbi:AAA family ATPase [Corynebacterium poyangense]|uniref:AAA family ATPase n=1 Tax=Corynebacterium poyangense TaxID=2684405 RepID=A0A7H0SNM3_9CORY|nr:UvrD-helicase domain-containing protein [Corynebacterium poyangense]QNQ90148.1 AAA family ATPase [Corynebacterium poyangense]